jgi:RNA polymerase-binding transcription factor DksA
MTTPLTPTLIDGTDGDGQLTSFRQQLNGLLREREAFIAELAPRAAPHIDLVAWSTTQSARRVVTHIEAALLRIEGGTFGTCSRCAGPIVRLGSRSSPMPTRACPATSTVRRDRPDDRRTRS